MDIARFVCCRCPDHVAEFPLCVHGHVFTQAALDLHTCGQWLQKTGVGKARPVDTHM